MRTKDIFTIGLLALAIAACDFGSTEAVRLDSLPSAQLQSERGISMGLDDRALMTNGILNDPWASGTHAIGFVKGLGVLVSAEGAVSGTWYDGSSDLQLTEGIVYARPQDVGKDVANWPRMAPTMGGYAHVPGDRVVTATYETAASPASEGARQGIFSNPVEGLSIGVTLFVEVDRSVRIRYSFMSDRALEDVVVGLVADFDVHQGLFTDGCEVSNGGEVPSTVEAPDNMLAFDIEGDFAYAFRTGSSCLSDAYGGLMVGVTPLERQTLAFRSVSPDTTLADDELRDIGIDSPEVARNILTGLTKDGLPMRHPRTGRHIRHMFSDDVSITNAWRSPNHDAAGLLSVEPFDLAQGEVKTIEFVLIVENSGSTAISLKSLRDRYARLSSLR